MHLVATVECPECGESIHYSCTTYNGNYWQPPETDYHGPDQLCKCELSALDWELLDKQADNCYEPLEPDF